MQWIFSYWVWCLYLIGGLIFFLATLICKTTTALNAILIIVSGVFFVSAFLWEYLRGQLAAEFSCLFPKYAKGQIIVFLSLITPVMLVWPTLFALHNSFSIPAMVAISLGTASAMAWALASLPARYAPSILALGLVVLVLKRPSLAEDFIYNRHPALALWAIIGCTSMLIVALWKLAHITADSPQVLRRPPASKWSNRQLSTGQTSDSWIPRTEFSWTRWHYRRKAYIPSRNTFWQRIQRWRNLNDGYRGFLIYYFLFMNLPFYHHPRAPNGDGSMVFPFFATLQSAVPIILVVQRWQAQWKYFAVESLKPLSRNTYLIELGVAAAVDLLECWFFWTVLLLLSIAVDEPAKIWLTCGFLVCQLLTLVFTFSAGVWVVRYREMNETSVIFALLTLIGCPILLAMLWWLGNWNIEVPVIGSFVLAIVGLFILYDAYRRWLLTEWG